MRELRLKKVKTPALVVQLKSGTQGQDLNLGCPTPYQHCCHFKWYHDYFKYSINSLLLFI